MKYSSANNNSMVPAIFALVVSGLLLSVSAWSDELVQEILAIEADPDYGEYLSAECMTCLLYTSPSPRDGLLSRMPSSA